MPAVKVRRKFCAIPLRYPLLLHAVVVSAGNLSFDYGIVGSLAAVTIDMLEG